MYSAIEHFVNMALYKCCILLLLLLLGTYGRFDGNGSRSVSPDGPGLPIHILYPLIMFKYFFCIYVVQINEILILILNKTSAVECHLLVSQRR